MIYHLKYLLLILHTIPHIVRRPTPSQYPGDPSAVYEPLPGDITGLAPIITSLSNDVVVGFSVPTALKGSVYCAAFPVDTGIDYASIVLNTGAGMFYMPRTSSVSLSISGLQPLTQYYMYCATRPYASFASIPLMYSTPSIS